MIAAVFLSAAGNRGRLNEDSLSFNKSQTDPPFGWLDRMAPHIDAVDLLAVRMAAHFYWTQIPLMPPNGAISSVG